MLELVLILFLTVLLIAVETVGSPIGFVPRAIAVLVSLVLMFMLPGAVLSLIALIPPIRTLGARSAKARRTAIFFFGLSAFLLPCLVWSYIGAQFTIGFGLGGLMDEEPGTQSAVVRELWLRNILPPVRSCFARDATICRLASLGTARYGAEDAGSWVYYLASIGYWLVSALTSAGLARRFMRLPSASAPVQREDTCEEGP